LWSPGLGEAEAVGVSFTELTVMLTVASAEFDVPSLTLN
jgi:hypothetical protein